MKRPSPATLTLAAIAAACVGLAHADPWADEGAISPLVSSKSNARRLLPEIADRSPDGATIELEPAHGEPVRLVPTAGGTHELFAGDTPLGPADPEAVAGLWASLRMATTLRAVPDDADASATTGRIRITSSADVLEVWVGAPAPDGAGLYGGRVRAPEGVEGTWVVEREVGELLEQAPRAWLAVRAVVVEPAELTELRFDDGLRLHRTADGVWHSELHGQSAMLEPTAVEHRLQRLVAARLDPLMPPDEVQVDTEAAPWLAMTAQDGRSFQLWRGGACPGRPARVVIARGPGLRGCLDTALTQPWPAVGRGTPDDGVLVDPRLVPPAYGRVLSIEQTHPDSRTLARYGGGWRVEETVSGQPVATEVDESEVFRFHQALHEAEVELALEPPPDSAARSAELVLSLDSGTRLRVRCVGEANAMRCRRDDGPWLQLRGTVPRLAFDAASFSDRRLVDLAVDDVRALEILPGPGSDEARQGAHFDLGVWRLDAPLHPAGDDVLDEDRLQELLAAVAGARAEAWVEPTDVSPRRILRIDRTPRRGEDATVTMELLPECRARVPGKPPAQLGEGTCATLGGDLLRVDVLRPLLRAAQTVELTVRGEEPVRLRGDAGMLRREDGAPMGELAAVIDELSRLQLTGIFEGRPPDDPRITLDVRPRHGAPFEVAVGRGWVAFDDATWWLRTRLAPPEDADD